MADALAKGSGRYDLQQHTDDHVQTIHADVAEVSDE